MGEPVRRLGDPPARLGELDIERAMERYGQGEPVDEFSQCDSVAEEEFLRELRMWLQAPITPQAPCGRFRLDFNVSDVGIEIDGREFHDSLRDEIRDACILATGAVRVIYRIRAADALYRPEDVVCALVADEPQLFTRRANHLFRPPWEREAEDDGDPTPVSMVRHSLDSRHTAQLAEWCASRPGLTLEALVKEWKKHWYRP